MPRFNSPIQDALRDAIRSRLHSMIYAALSSALEADEDPKDLLKEWRDLGTYHLAALLAASVSPDPNSYLYPRRFWIDPWIAERLRGLETDNFFYIVGRWLDGQPLEEHISAIPEVEDAKVRHLSRLLTALNPGR